MSAMIQLMCVSRFVITQLDHAYVLVKQDMYFHQNNRSCDGRKSTVLLHIMLLKFRISIPKCVFFYSSFLCPQMSMNVMLIMEIVLKSV